MIFWFILRPGIIFSDTGVQAWMGENGNQYTYWKPILTTLAYKFFTNNGTNWQGFQIYTLFQVAIISVIIYFAIITLVKCGLNKRTAIIICILYACLPTYILYSVHTESDVLCSIFFLMFETLIFVLLMDKGNKKTYILLILATFFIIQTRNNGLIPVLLTAIVFLIFTKNKREILKCSVAVAILCILVQLISTITLHPQKISTTDYLELPIQQIASVYNSTDGKISDEQHKYFSSIFYENRLRTNYNPQTIDSIKGGLPGKESAIKEPIKINAKFIQMYFSLGADNKMLYIKAFLGNSTFMWQFIPDNFESMRSIFPTTGMDSVSNNPLKRAIQKLFRPQNGFSANYENVKTFSGNKTNIIMEGIFDNTPFPFYLLLILIGIVIRKYKKDALLLLIPCFGFLVSLAFFVPARQFRYILPIAFVLPFLYCAINLLLSKSTKQ
jgi:hypothetical protein